MGVTVREKPKGSGIWWVFLAHEGKRKSKRIGNDKRIALEVAKKIEARIFTLKKRRLTRFLPLVNMPKFGLQQPFRLLANHQPKEITGGY